jgi:hypothetical protein
MPPKVNSGVEWRHIPKSVVTAHVEVLEERSHVEWFRLCVLSNDAPASVREKEEWGERIRVRGERGSESERWGRGLVRERERERERERR